MSAPSAQLLLAAVFATHAGLVLRLVSLPDVLGPLPFATADYGLHFHEALNVRHHLERSWALWGYSVEWMAGFPEGLIGLVDNKLFFLLVSLAPAGHEAAVFNAGVLLLLLVPPIALHLGVRLGGGSRQEATAAAACAVVVTFAVPLSRFFWIGGGISFFAASALSVAFVMAMSRALTDGSLFRMEGLVGCLFGLGAVFIHPATAVIAGPGILAAAIASGFTRRKLLELSSMAGLLALPLVPLLAAAWDLRDLVRPVPAGPFLQGGWDRLASDWFWRIGHTGTGWDGGSGGAGALIALAIPGAIGCGPRPRAWKLCLGASLVACFLLAYASSSFSAIWAMQPYRFLIPFSMFLCIPAGLGVVRILRDPSSWVHLGLGALAVLLVAEAGVSLVPPAALGSGHDSTEDHVVDILRNHTDAEDRIAVESAWLPVPAWRGSQRTIDVQRFRLLPLRLDREFIGHGVAATFLRHRYAGFSGRRLFGKETEGLAPTELDDLLARYAIHWVVAWQTKTVDILKRHPTVLEEVLRAGEAVLFQVQSPASSRFLKGEGSVRAGFDRLDVEVLEGEQVILKYHWTPTLQAPSPIELFEAPIPGAPVGFLGIRPNGRRQFRIVHDPTP